MPEKKSFSHPPGAAVQNPGSTVINKTGAWRTFKPTVDFNKCTGCGICVRFCPDGCIELAKPEGFKPAADSKIANPLKAIIDYDYCKGCRICEVECPFKAVSSKVEEK